MINIAVCIDDNDWHIKFRHYLELHALRDDITIEYININYDNWLEMIQRFDAVIWKSSNMGPQAAAYFKEKIYFIEKYLAKLVVPNFSTIWHFESKAAQSYVFKQYIIPTPKTVVSFDIDDALALLDKSKMPLVLKEPFGAASKNVRLIKNKATIRAYIKTTLSCQMFKKILSRFGLLIARSSKYYWCYLFESKVRNNNQRCVYWQELIPDNSRDLRITVIGDRYAFAFWRKNRPNDFRASGSGNIDYSDPIPNDVVLHCIALNKKFDFDSMAYDIVFSDGQFRVIEMSYGYIDTAIYNSPGYYYLQGHRLEFNSGHYWPQELWAKWLLHRIDKRFEDIQHV